MEQYRASHLCHVLECSAVHSASYREVSNQEKFRSLQNVYTFIQDLSVVLKCYCRTTIQPPGPVCSVAGAPDQPTNQSPFERILRSVADIPRRPRLALDRVAKTNNNITAANSAGNLLLVRCNEPAAAAAPACIASAAGQQEIWLTGW